MWNSSKFQNTIMMVHKQLSTVFALAIKMSSCIAVSPPLQHWWNNPATSWSQHRRGSCKNHKSLDKYLTKASCNGVGWGEQTEIKARWLDQFSEQNHLKENKTCLFKRVFCLGKATSSSWEDVVCQRQARNRESEHSHVFCPMLHPPRQAYSLL